MRFESDGEPNAFELRHFADLDYETIAAAQGIQRSTVVEVSATGQRFSIKRVRRGLEQLQPICRPVPPQELFSLPR